jgi:hypothetical protein
VSTILRRAFVEQPLAWGTFALAFFAYVSRLPSGGWNVEILIARNLLRGHGFVVGPADPPALWRPPLAVFGLLPIELLVDDPEVVYKVFATICLSVTTVVLFYLMKRVGGLAAAHFSQLFAFTLPALTTLVHRQFQMLSHLIMFATVTTAILLTLDAWSKPSRRRDAFVGLSWGVAFLARPEMSVLFGVTFVCSAIAYRGGAKGLAPVWQKLLIQAVCFLLVYVPTSALLLHLQRKHELIGQVPLVTYYAGAYFASNTQVSEPENQGYADTIRQFGAPATYGYSLVQFAWAQPAAILRRIEQNVGNTIALFASGDLLQPIEWLLFVTFGAVLSKSTPPPIPRRYLLLYGALLSAVSTYFLLFHVDPRYPLPFVLILLIWFEIAAIQLWRRVGRWADSAIAPSLIATCTLVLVGLFVFRLNAAVASAQSVELDLAPFRAVAERFRDGIGPNGTPSVSFSPPVTDAIWISYFADTSIAWHVESSVFPRDKIYSFTNRAEEYMLVPASMDRTSLGNPPVLWRDVFPRIGEYVCVDLRGRSAPSQ